MSEITKDEIRERLGNIDQIRDIIFGVQLREYNNRLDKLESDLLLLQQEVRDRLEQVKTSFSADLKKSMESLEKKLKSSQANAQEESADLRQQLDRLNKKLTGSIEALDESVDAQTHSIREEMTQTRDRLQEDVSALRDLVLEELERRFGQLRDMKVAKDDMAEILLEFGMRLKGAEVVPALKEAATRGNGYGLLPMLEAGQPSEASFHAELTHLK